MTDQMPFNDDYDSTNSGNADVADLGDKKIKRRE